MKYEYKTHAAYRGYGWIEPLTDPEDPLIGDYLARRICEELNTLQAEVEALRAELAALKTENEMLREALKDADNELDWLDEDIGIGCDHSVGVCTCDYWDMRRKMKAALEQENTQ